VAVIVSVLPGAPLAGLALSVTPTGAAVTVSAMLFDTHPVAAHGVGFVTWMGTEPADATSEAWTLTLSCVPFTNVTGRAAPPTVAVAPATKPLPFTWSVKAARPAVTLAGERPVSAGAFAAVTVSAMLFDTQLAAHGVGFVTWIGTEPADATSEAWMLMVTCVALTNVVARATPPTVAVAPAANPLPFTWSVKAARPAVTLEGERPVIPGVPPTAVPDTTREIVSPSAVKFRLVVVTPEAIGANCTTTVPVVPSPARWKGLPDTILNGAATETAPETVPPREFVTVNDCVAVDPTLMLPKFTAVGGVTPNVNPAMALAAFEHPLSLPLRSMALTEMK